MDSRESTLLTGSRTAVADVMQQAAWMQRLYEDQDGSRRARAC